MRMSRAHWEEIVTHARDTAPNECCGYARVDDGRVQEVHRATSLRDSPYAYELDGRSLLTVNQLDEDGHGVAVYHSHPRSPAEPSQTDINLAHYPTWTYLIVSLRGEPEIRAWTIAEGRVREQPVEVE